MAITIREGAVAIITTSIVDKDGTKITNARLNELRLTYFDRRSRRIINSRQDQDALNANGVTVSNGDVTWVTSVSDSAIIDPPTAPERHVATFRFRYDGTTWGDGEIDIDVTNLRGQGV